MVVLTNFTIIWNSDTIRKKLVKSWHECIIKEKRTSFIRRVFSNRMRISNDSKIRQNYHCAVVLRGDGKCVAQGHLHFLFVPPLFIHFPWRVKGPCLSGAASTSVTVDYFNQYLTYSLKKNGGTQAPIYTDTLPLCCSPLLIWHTYRMQLLLTGFGFPAKMSNERSTYSFL